MVLTGEGKFFSNGLNLPELQKLGPSGMQEFWQEVTRVMGRLLVSPVASVAALNGHTFAGGAMIALACDFRVMREDKGWFCLPEIDIGMPLPPPVMAMVSAKLSAATVRDAALTGKRFPSDEAAAAGIIDATATEDELLSKAKELAAGLASKNRSVLRTMKVTLWGDVARGLGIELE